MSNQPASTQPQCLPAPARDTSDRDAHASVAGDTQGNNDSNPDTCPVLPSNNINETPGYNENEVAAHNPQTNVSSSNANDCDIHGKNSTTIASEWPRFGQESGSDVYFKQHVSVLTNSGTALGGLRGVIWRSRHETKD